MSIAESLSPAQEDMLTLLRGARDQRPTFDRDLRRRLQRELDNGLEDVEGQMNVSKKALTSIHQCEGLFVAPTNFLWSPRTARGTIAHVAIELAAGLAYHPLPYGLVDGAMLRVKQRTDMESLSLYLDEIDDNERLELRVQAADLVIKFQELFPPLKDQWRPNAEARVRGLVNKRISLRGKIDLKLGAPQGSEAGTLLIDFKTGTPSLSDLSDLRFYALIETLRTGTPPFKWASVYLESGYAEEETVSEDVLWSTVRRVVDGVRKMAALNAGREPELTPGVGCKFCPVRSTCESGPGDYDEVGVNQLLT